MSKFLNVRIDLIVESRWQTRDGAGDSAAFEELVANVKTHGVTSPLKAFVNKEGAYELITGHRRRRAAIKAGLTHVLLVVVDTPKGEAGLRALREEVLFDNLLHEPLTPLEEARALEGLREEEGYSIRQMAERLGKSRGYISERLSLLDKPQGVQEMVSARADTLRHAREIAKVEDPEQRAELIEEAIAGASSRDIKARVDQVVPTKVHTRRPPSAPDEALEPSEEEPCSEPVEGPVGERLIPVNGNGKTAYITVPEPSPEPALSGVEGPRPRPVTGTVCACAKAHCPHCGDGRGKERCNSCGKERWIIAFDNIEDYHRAVALVGALIQKQGRKDQ